MRLSATGASVFPRVCFYISRWRTRARRIPDPVLRQLALDALDKRGNIEGAAAFAAFVPLARRAKATRATVPSRRPTTYSTCSASSRAPTRCSTGGRLHEALVYAVTPRGAAAPLDSEVGSLDTDSSGIDPCTTGGARALDWYEHHPQRDDGGYLDGADRGVPRRVRGTALPPPGGALGTGRGRPHSRLSESEPEQVPRRAHRPGAVGAHGHAPGNGLAMVGDRRRRRLLAWRARADRGRRRATARRGRSQRTAQTPTFLGSAACTHCWTI